MWFATQDGLNKYDGYNFTVYRTIPGDPDSIGFNYIRAIIEDSNGKLWIGTSGAGLDQFDRDTAHFIHHQSNPGDPHSLSDNTIFSLFEDQEGTLWIGTSNGLNSYDPSGDSFTRYQYVEWDPNSLSGNIVRSILEDHHGQLWIGTEDGGLNKLDPEGGGFLHYKHDPNDEHSLSSDHVAAIYEDRGGVLWIGTEGGGLNRFDRVSGKFQRFMNDPDDPSSISSDSVSEVFEDREGNLWIGTLGGGLDLFHRETGQFAHYQHDPGDPWSLSVDWVLSIYEDRAGELWVGTVGGGINKLDRATKPFLLIQTNPKDPNSLSTNFIWSILEDSSGMLWVGTQGGGLNEFDRESESWFHYQHDPDDPESLSNDVVRSIAEGPEGSLWVGTEGGGLDLFDPDTETFYHYRHDASDPRSLSSDDVLVVYEDRAGMLWIGTFGGGLNRFDPSTENFTRYLNDDGDPSSLSNNNVRAIYEDYSGTLWVGTEFGLNRLDRTGGRFSRYLTIPDNLFVSAILSIHEDRSGALWLGTFGGGLVKLDRKGEPFTHYSEDDGLPSNVVYGILEDDEGFLWLSTNSGLSKFDPRTVTFTKFDVTDGLQSNEFNGGAYVRGGSGEMYFGGVNGLNVFDPELIVENPYQPAVVLTSLTQGGESLELGEAVENIEELTFHWPDNSFEFEIAAMSFRQPEKNQYAYMLEGFDEGWNEIGTNRLGKYTNLPSGTYTLRIKGSNNDGLWNDEGTSIMVTIVPPIWRTWPFIGLVLVLITGSIFALFRLRVRSAEVRSRELEVQVEKRTEELRHEIDQRMQVEEALRQSEMEKAITAERSRLARELHDAVTQSLFSANLIAEALPSIWKMDQDEGKQLLEELRLLSRGALAEMRTLLMELRPDTLIEANIRDLMNQLAETVMGRKGIPVEVDVTCDGSLPSDLQVGFYRIAQEALNNVVKHANATQATIHLHCESLPAVGGETADVVDKIELIVTDDGRGFDPASVPLDRLGLSTMRERAMAFGAQLDIDSEVGGGTKVRVLWTREGERIEDEGPTTNDEMLNYLDEDTESISTFFK